jgi:hypothetical protein
MNRKAKVECQCIKNKFRQYHTTDLYINMDFSTLEDKATEVSQNVWHLSPRDAAPHSRRSETPNAPL